MMGAFPSSATSRQREGRAGVSTWSLGAIFLGGILARLLCARAYPVIQRDGVTFLFLARAAREGRWPDLLAHDQHPLFPALVALFQPLLGNWERTGFALNSIASALTAIPVALLGARLGGRRAGILAGCLCAVGRYPVQYGANVLSDGLHGLCFAAAALAGAIALGIGDEKKSGAGSSAAGAGAAPLSRGRWFFAAGLAAGLAYLTRPEGLVIAAALGLAALGQWRGTEPAGRRVVRWARGQALLALGLALTAGPYAWHLSQETGSLTLTRKKSLAQALPAGISGSRPAGPRTKGPSASPPAPDHPPASPPAPPPAPTLAPSPESSPAPPAPSSPMPGAPGVPPPAEKSTVAAIPPEKAPAEKGAVPPAGNGGTALAVPLDRKVKRAPRRSAGELDEQRARPGSSFLPPRLVGVWEATAGIARCLGAVSSFLFLLGIAGRRKRREPFLAGFYLLIPAAIFIVLESGMFVVAGYTSRRHAYPITLLFLPFAGDGFAVLAGLLARIAPLARWRERLPAILGAAATVGISLKSAALFPVPPPDKDRWTIEAARELRERAAGERLGPEESVLVIGDPEHSGEALRVAFYTGARIEQDAALRGVAGLFQGYYVAGERSARTILVAAEPGVDPPPPPEGWARAPSAIAGDHEILVYRRRGS